jgi:hypothetical protein
MSKPVLFVLASLGLAASLSISIPRLSSGAFLVTTGCDPITGDASTPDDFAADGAAVREQLDYTTLCQRLIAQCGQAINSADCVRSYASLRVTPTCKNGIAQATCDDLSNPASAVETACFPPCNGMLAQCNGDGTITTCTPDGITQVLDCQGYCLAQGFTGYTGTCAATYQGQTSASPQCWCQ